MPETKPREPETTAPTTGDGAPSSAPGRTGDKTAKQDAPFVWPRDLNAPSSDKPEWGTEDRTSNGGLASTRPPLAPDRSSPSSPP